MDSNPAAGYHFAGRRLDEHMRDCPLCATGRACADGDQTAEDEYRAWRTWQDHDPAGADAYAQRGWAG